MQETIIIAVTGPGKPCSVLAELASVAMAFDATADNQPVVIVCDEFQ